MVDSLLSSPVKACSKCGEEKSVELFYRRKSSTCKYGRSMQCKVCENERRARWLSDPDVLEANRRTQRKSARKRRAAGYEREIRAKIRDEYVEEHGVPLCQCGCGKEVGFQGFSKQPNRFAHGHGSRDPEVNEKRIKSTFKNDIPVEDFRNAIKKVQEQRGMTWQEVARVAGIGQSHFYYLMFDKGKRFVVRRLAENIFKRLAGIPTLPTAWERRVADGHTGRIWEHEI